MRTKDEDLARKIKNCIEEYYCQYGTSPTVRYIASQVGYGESNIPRYIDYLRDQGLLTIGDNGYETDITRTTETNMIVAPKTPRDRGRGCLWSGLFISWLRKQLDETIFTAIIDL